MKYLIILLLLASCHKPEVCYECEAVDIHETFCGATPEEMQRIIDFWAEKNITLKCKEVEK